MNQLNEAFLEKLTTSVKEGNSAAFSTLYGHYKHKVRDFAYRFVRCDELATELTQLAFVQLWNYRHTIDLEKDFNAFLFTITRNLVYKEFQRKARHAAYQAEISRTEPVYDPVSSFTDYRDYKTLVTKAIESLPPQSKRVFKLSREHGASYEDISVALNISKNTVHSHMAKSLSHIRAYFKVHTPETILMITIVIHFF